MRQLTGRANCKDEMELNEVIAKLNHIPAAITEVDGLTVNVLYTPLDTNSDSEIGRTVARILDVIESVYSHGFSIISERG